MKPIISAEGFRERLRACRPDANESFGKKLSHLLQRWVDRSQTEKSYDALFDFVLAEQSLASMSKDLAVFLRERDLMTSGDLIKHAESFRLAHPNKHLARKSDQSLFVSGNTGASANVAHQRGNV